MARACCRPSRDHCRRPGCCPDTRASGDAPEVAGVDPATRVHEFDGETPRSHPALGQGPRSCPAGTSTPNLDEARACPRDRHFVLATLARAQPHWECDPPRAAAESGTPRRRVEGSARHAGTAPIGCRSEHRGLSPTSRAARTGCAPRASARVQRAEKHRCLPDAKQLAPGRPNPRDRIQPLDSRGLAYEDRLCQREASLHHRRHHRARDARGSSRQQWG